MQRDFKEKRCAHREDTVCDEFCPAEYARSKISRVKLLSKCTVCIVAYTVRQQVGWNHKSKSGLKDKNLLCFLRIVQQPAFLLSRPPPTHDKDRSATSSGMSNPDQTATLKELSELEVKSVYHVKTQMCGPGLYVNLWNTWRCDQNCMPVFPTTILNMCEYHVLYMESFYFNHSRFI